MSTSVTFPWELGSSRSSYKGKSSESRERVTVYEINILEVRPRSVQNDQQLNIQKNKKDYLKILSCREV